ncbi:MAG: hypothetical protein AMS15_02950 [Planctomycetes bacterium DG_23]|nr:MAG: hypothetical protein AMS15_02950 [Planctomycetes bacterium DG_23]
MAAAGKSIHDLPGQETPGELLVVEAGTPWPALLIAIVVTVAMNALVAVTTQSLRTLCLMSGMLPLGVFLPFIVLAFIVNPLIRAATGRYLHGWELVLIFSVGYVSAPIAELVSRWIATIAVPYYLASPENQWAEYVFPHLKKWLVVKSEPEYLRWFYEGMPEGARFPWQVWVVPLFWWLSFFVAIGLVCLSLATILRRQWVENERLPFPLAQVPLELARDTTRPSGLPEYMRGRLFWIGFIIPFFIVCWEVMTYFYPGLPSLKVGVSTSKINFGREFPDFFTKVNFFIIAFGYFTSLKILFSIWFFNTLAIFQEGYSIRMGIPEYVVEQSTGAFILFVFWGLWMARRQIGRAFAKALGLRNDVDDSRELFSYRTAVFGLIIGPLFMIFWLKRAGAGNFAAILWTLSLFIFYIGVAKIAAASGLIFLAHPGSATGMVSTFIPKAMWGPSNIVTNTLMGCTYQNAKGWVMPAAAHSARLIHLLKKKARIVGMVVAITFILAILSNCLTTVYLGYRVGAFNYGSYVFNRAGPRYWDNMVISLKELDRGGPKRPKAQFGYFVFGILACIFLIFMNYRFTWWPLHPVGFTVAKIYSVRTAAFSFFIVWLCKLIILRVGGMSLYNRAKAFFLGTIVGYALGLLVTMVVDMIFFPGKGHNLYYGD